ncbi:MAG TPA: flagellar basal-body rod protein FlgF [Steroidobacteraceae bacterium]|nr:flagellar basal-body rod protein FlgF [Steroidobacteraceae bacterium]
MFGAIYTGLAGMTAYSQGLDLISNNVANLNTPGFKVSDPLFREIVYRHLGTGGSRDSGDMPSGAGVEMSAAGLSFKQGELRETGNPLDAAIDGNGFFVLDIDGEYRYTRAGQFEFNDDGILVEKSSGGKVMMSTDTLGLTSFDLNTARVYEPKATTEVKLTGTLARGGTTTTFEVPSVTVYDKAGVATSVRVRFTRSDSDPLSWHAEVLDSASAVIGSGDVSFAEDGTPADGAGNFTVTITSSAGNSSDVKFTLGDAGSFAGVTSPAASTTSQVQLLKQDGLPIGSLTKTEFDDKGALKLTYSNGESKTVATLVLARFDAPEQLRPLGGGMFSASDAAPPVFGGALQKSLGRVVGGQLEMSNVELTQQFTDLIVLQRGYQASSQVSSVANELIQTLLAMDGRR